MSVDPLRRVRTPDARFDALPDYRFAPNYIEDLPSYNGLRVHYLDEGDRTAEHTFLCLHGQPSWSYLYRKMIPRFVATGGRVIAPDWLGFGKSDKPIDDHVYTFTFHRQMMIELIERLDLTNVTLVCQDWGGLLGLTIPPVLPGRFVRLLVMNTALSTGAAAGPGFADWLAYNRSQPDLDLNAFFKRSIPSLSDAEAAAYAAPFPDVTFKAGVRRFPELVMIDPDMDGVTESRTAARWWATEWSGQSFMAIGMADRVITPKAMHALATKINGCPTPLELADVGHFVQEAGDVVALAALASFGNNNPNPFRPTFEQAVAEARRRSDLNAFITLAPSKPISTSVSGATAGLATGRLDGMVIAVKDNVHVAGMPNTAGTPGLERFYPETDAPLISLLKAEGAVVLGKTNMHELAAGVTTNNPHFGVARNPYDTDRSPGGSSGGSAAAVAARIVPAAIGGDTAASIRLPAALCGIFGFRPTIGRYPIEGITPFSSTRDTPGPMALTIDDITLLDSVMSGRAEITKPADLSQVRIGVPRNPFFNDLHPEIDRQVQTTLDLVAAHGATLVSIDMAGLLEAATEAGLPIVYYEATADLDAYLTEHNVKVTFAEIAEQIASPDIQGAFQAMAQDTAGTGHPDGIITRPDYLHALNTARPTLINMYTECFSKHNLDAIIFPTAIAPAPTIEESFTVTHNGTEQPTLQTFMRNTDPGSAAGLPGINIPIGLTTNGLPIGIELDALQGTDEQLLAIARAIAAVHPQLPAPTQH